MAPLKVLISGAGIAGSTLAWHLAKIGAHVTVVEKAASLLPHGQSIDIQGTARRVIHQMGLTDTILKYRSSEEGTRFIDPQGRSFAPFPVRKGTAASFTSEYEILRGDLAKLLCDANKEEVNVKYLFDTTVSTVLSNTDKEVKVELSTGEHRTYDFLCLADGQWSTLRRQVFPAENVRSIDKGMYGAYWTIPRIAGDDDWWNVYHALGSRIIALRPDRYGNIRVLVTIMPCDEQQAESWKKASRAGRDAQETLVRSTFADAGWQAQRVLEGMSDAPDFYFQAIAQIKMESWYQNRVICIGDTAYAPSPLTGMGTSLALLGGYVLAGELSKITSNVDVINAFQAYQDVFKPFVEDTQKLPSFVPGFAHPSTAFKRRLFHNGIWILSNALRVMQKLPYFAKRLIPSDVDDFCMPIYPALTLPKEM